MEQIEMPTGEGLRRLREAAGVSSSEIAEVVGKTRQAVEKAEGLERVPVLADAYLAALEGLLARRVEVLAEVRAIQKAEARRRAAEERREERHRAHLAALEKAAEEDPEVWRRDYERSMRNADRRARRSSTGGTRGTAL